MQSASPTPTRSFDPAVARDILLREKKAKIRLDATIETKETIRLHGSGFRSGQSTGDAYVDAVAGILPGKNRSTRVMTMKPGESYDQAAARTSKETSGKTKKTDMSGGGFRYGKGSGDAHVDALRGILPGKRDWRVLPYQVTQTELDNYFARHRNAMQAGPTAPRYPVNDAAVSRAADAEQTLPDDSESRRASAMQRNKIANTLPTLPPRQAEDADEAALEDERNEQEQSSMADARQAEDMNRLAALQSQNESARQAYAQGMIAQTSKKAAASINRYIWQIAGSLGMIPVDGSETYSVGTSVSTYQLIMGALSRMGSDLDEGIQKSPLGYVIPPGHGKDIIGMFMIVYSVFLLLWSGVVATLIIVAIMYMLDLIFPGSSDALFSIFST